MTHKVDNETIAGMTHKIDIEAEEPVATAVPVSENNIEPEEAPNHIGIKSGEPVAAAVRGSENIIEAGEAPNPAPTSAGILPQLLMTLARAVGPIIRRGRRVRFWEALLSSLNMIIEVYPFIIQVSDRNSETLRKISLLAACISLLFWILEVVIVWCVDGHDAQYGELDLVELIITIAQLIECSKDLATQSSSINNGIYPLLLASVLFLTRTIRYLCEVLYELLCAPLGREEVQFEGKKVGGGGEPGERKVSQEVPKPKEPPTYAHKIRQRRNIFASSRAQYELQRLFPLQTGEAQGVSRGPETERAPDICPQNNET